MHRKSGGKKKKSAEEAISPYEVLGVPLDASDEQIRKAYLENVRLSPPERNPDVFKDVRRAYGMLKDGAKRRELDLSLFRRKSGLEPEEVSVDFLSLFLERIFKLLLISSDFYLEDFSRDFQRHLDEEVKKL